MRHRIISTVCLMIMYGILPILSIQMVHHVTVSETLSSMDSGGFGKTYGMFTVASGRVSAAQVYTLLQEKEGAYALYADAVQEDDTIVRSLYFNDTYVNLPMKWGRFFRASDFQAEKPYAVVGKGLGSRIRRTGTNDRITVNGIEYEVIGMIGYDCRTSFDRYIFVNGLVDRQTPFATYTVDCFRVADPDRVVGQFVAELNRNGLQAQTLVVTKRFISSFLPKIAYSRWFLLLLAGDLVCLAILTLEWLETWKTEVSIRLLVGGTPGQVMAYMGMRYGLFYAASLLIGICDAAIWFPAYLQEIGLGYLVLFLVAAPLFVYTVNRFLHNNVAQEVAKA